LDNKNGILLESGTNEFEIVEFSVGPVTYGINVAKVREVINPLPVTQMANSHRYIDGIFKLRGNVIPLVNLSRCLGIAGAETDHKVIVCEINKVLVGFKVDAVYRIHRIFWTQMESSPDVVGTDLVIGIVKMDEKLIILLDFERILAEVNPEINRKFSEVPVATPDLIHLRESKTILVAEDSRMLRDLLVATLHGSGYNIITCENGQVAWDRLTAFASIDKPLPEQLQLVVTDIEMPNMDGHHLLKRIKENPRMEFLPVVIFSSLINDEMRLKGEALKAAAQITKPEITQLIEIVDRLVGVVA
jgi:two-component system, chemotaxis family, chemotaxis protein CheV